MHSSTDRAQQPMPFWQWKEQQYAKDQAAGTPHTKDWYYRAYGGYCEKVRTGNEPSQCCADRVKRAAIYRGAAHRLGEMHEWGCCDQIRLVATGDPVAETPLADLFEAMFMPEGTKRVYWGELWGGSAEEIEGCRILALCFMAAMVEAGDA